MVWYGRVWYGMVWYAQTESIQKEPYRAFAAIRIWSKYEKITANLRIDSSTILLTSKSFLLWSSFCKLNNRMFHLKTLSLLRENPPSHITDLTMSIIFLLIIEFARYLSINTLCHSSSLTDLATNFGAKIIGSILSSKYLPFSW